MAYHRETYYAPCSCNVGCPCTLGRLEAGRGWCSGTLVFDIQGGNVDGTDVGGTKVAVVGDWPSGSWPAPVGCTPTRASLRSSGAP